MSRFFIEVSYMGTAYAGFQIQENANTIQAEVEKAFRIYFRKPIELTGSSRTDAGVHALQNYFHFDEGDIREQAFAEGAYHLNAILPGDIVIRKIFEVNENAHCRFDAVSRTYHYSIYNKKDPFIRDRAYYYPFELDIIKLNEAASIVSGEIDFEAFAKKNNQVHTNNCNILQSVWVQAGSELQYIVTGNRFLRGMVRGLTGTMLKVGRGNKTKEEFAGIFSNTDITKVDFSVPAHGLALYAVNFAEMRAI